MDKDEARAIAAEHIGEGRTTPAGVTLTIVDSETREGDFGWVFFYDSREYMETGDFRYAIAGNAPVVVLRDGSIRETGTARPIDDYLSEIEKSLKSR